MVRRGLGFLGANSAGSLIKNKQDDSRGSGNRLASNLESRAFPSARGSDPAWPRPPPRPRPRRPGMLSGPVRQVLRGCLSCPRRLCPPTARLLAAARSGEVRCGSRLPKRRPRAEGTPGSPGAAERRAGRGRRRPSRRPGVPRGEARAGRTLPGLLSHLNPLPVGRAFPAAPAPAPLVPGRCLCGRWREERAGGPAARSFGSEEPRAAPRETRCPPGPRPLR